MDLKPVHVPWILAGIPAGAGVGFLLSFFFGRGAHPSLGDLLTVQHIGLIFGGIGGAGLAILVLAVRASHRPEAGVPSNWSQINGMGSALIGKSEVHQDGSYLTTEWFVVLWIPVFPICTYRVVKLDGSLIWQQYTVLEKRGVRLRDLTRGYVRTLAMAAVIAFVAWVMVE